MSKGQGKSLFYSGGRAFRCSKGFEVRNGKRVQKFFSLGSDAVRSERIARALNAAWENETTNDEAGRKVWSQACIDWAFAAGGDETPSAVPAATTAPEPHQGREQVVADKLLPVEQAYTLADALERYAQHYATIFTISDAQRKKRSCSHSLGHSPPETRGHRFRAAHPSR